MDLAPDFVMTPLPPIREGAGFDVASDPLGRLAGLVGSWSGTGFNVIWRPESVPGQDRFLELNRTTETLEFERVPGSIPNRGFLQGDIEMFGVHYLQQITDANLNAGLHFEPGIWAHVPKTSNPSVPVSIVRMASIPHGTTIVAQGTSSDADELTGPPVFKPISIKPFGIGAPSATIDFPEQTLSNPTQFRTPAAGLVGITQAMVNDPSQVLKAGIPANVASTVRLHVSTDPKPVIAGGTSNTAFLEGAPDPQQANANADAVTVSASFWLQTLQGQTQPTVLQYNQTVLLNFNGISWPHISVATLTRTA